MRLSGLTSGARLTLVQSSRSPSVVSVAIQLPTAGGEAGALGRLVDKFPSNTSLWQILRRLENGAAGTSSSQQTSKHNFTQRAVARLANGNVDGSGAGRMFYEMPTLNIMQRELGTFLDLQKTLAQLGHNGGSVLMRLGFRVTEQPLEEAMTEISTYFQEAEKDETPQTTIETPAPASEAVERIPTPNGDMDIAQQSSVEPPALPQQETMSPSQPSDATQSALETSDRPTTPKLASDSSGHPQHNHESSSSDITIFNPPTTPRPRNSLTRSSDADFTPTVDHMKQHQRLLSSSGKNQRLPSDAEIAARQREAVERRENVQNVTIRLRLPDQSLVQRDFGRDATVASLYTLCSDVMVERANGRVELRAQGVPGGVLGVEKSGTGMGKTLIQDLGWSGRVLVTVGWKEDVRTDLRQSACLKGQYKSQAKALEVPTSAETGAHDAVGLGGTSAVDHGSGKDKGKKKGGDVEAKMKKFLGFNNFGKK